MADIIRVLLIEDDEDDYFLTADYLSQCNDPKFIVTWVTNSEDALIALKNKQFDICLLDYLLGVENALDVLERLKSEGITIPVVILTGQSNAQVDELVMRAGAADYLTKSELETPRFMRTIRYAMVRREFENERLERLKVEQQNKAKDKFLAHLGHELRTPLTSILGYTELLLDDKDNQAIGQELSIIHTNGKHLLSLLNDLLDMSRIMANKLELAPREVNLGGLMTDVHSLMNLSAKDKGLELKFHSCSKVPEFITTDPTRLRQVLINLISNALKFTDSGEIEVTVALEGTSLPHAKEVLCFRIRDTGIGMPPNKLDTIFHPFEQIEDVMRANHGGAGLGLAICRELVTKMGGEIQVESEFGSGSTFSFSIDPGDISRQPRDKLHLGEPDSEPDNGPSLYVSGRVLIVDDLRELRRLTGHLVSQCHATVAYAENGVKALEMVLMAEQQNEPFHLVLMDIHMPVMNGIEALKALRRHNSQVAVVAITAASRKGLRQSLMQEGFDDVIDKPIEKQALLQVLDKYLIPSEGKFAPPQSHCGQTASQSGKKVLVVEDDRDSAELLQLLLAHQGHDVIVAHSGEEAMARVRDNFFDHVLLDLTLPDTHGLELAKYIKEHQSNTDVVVVSGHEPESVALQKLGIRKALLKPVTKQDLVSLFG